MTQEFRSLILATYADLCIDWRREVVSCRSNALDLNEKLTSLESVMKSFEFAVPGLFDNEPNAADANPTADEDLEPNLDSDPAPIGEPTTAVYEARPQDEPKLEAEPADAEPQAEREPEPAEV